MWKRQHPLPIRHRERLLSCPPDNVPILNTSGTPLLEINLTFGEARIQNNIPQACNITKLDMLMGAPVPVQRFFMVSRTRNIFTAVGCSTVALIAGDIETPIGENGGFSFYTISACGSFCAEDTIDSTSTDCSGRGCCQTAIPRNLKSFFPVFLNNSLIRAQNFSPCSYAFIAETGWFSFDPSYVTSQNLQNQFGFGPPLVLDWVVGNGSCEAASWKTGPSYPCADANSECVDVPSGPGYRCNCSTGYEGNPYLAGGCRGQHAPVSIIDHLFAIYLRFIICRRLLLIPLTYISTDMNECDYPPMYP
jgi:hypothetical protein